MVRQSTDSKRKMNDKFCAPMALTNGEVRENGEIKNSASGDDYGAGDSRKTCLENNDNFKSRITVPDSKSGLEFNLGMSCDYPVLKGSASVSNVDNLPANMISKQVDPCEPDSKGSDSLVEDSADTVIENEVDDDFKLSLSPEVSGADSLSEPNEEDSTVQATKSSNNISEDMGADKHKEESKLSAETEGPNLGNKSSDIARLTDVNLGSNIYDCAVGEGVSGGDSEMIVEEDSASDACVGDTSNNESGSGVPSLLTEDADHLNETSETSEVTLESSTSGTLDKCEDAVPSSNVGNCQQSSTSPMTQDETKDAALGATTVGNQVSSTSSTAQDGMEGAVQSSNTEGCSETFNNFSCSDEKSTNVENDTGPVLDKVKNNGESVDDVKNNEGYVLDDFKNNAETVVDEVKHSAEPVMHERDAEFVVDKLGSNTEPEFGKLDNNAKCVIDDLERNLEPLLDDLDSKMESVSDDKGNAEQALGDCKSNAGPVLDDKGNAEPILDDLSSNAETLSDDLKSNAETLSDDLKSNAETLSDDLKSNAETLSDDLKSNAETVSDLKSNAKPVSDDKGNAEPILDDLASNAESVSDDLKSNMETVSDDLKSNSEHVPDDKGNAEHVLDDLANNAETVSDDLKKIAEPILDDLECNAEPVVDGQCENSFKKSCLDKENVNDVIRELEETSDVQIRPEKHRSDIKNEIVSGENFQTVGKVEEKVILGSDNVGEGNVGSVASPSTKTDSDSNDEITSVINEGSAFPINKKNDDSWEKETALSTSNVNNEKNIASPASKISEGNIDKVEADREDALLVSPNKTTSLSNESSSSTPSMEVASDEELLKSPERKKEGEQIVNMEEEAALLSSPDRKVARKRLLEETEDLEDDALLNSPEPKVKNGDRTDIEMKNDDLLNSPEIKAAVEIDKFECLREEKMEDESNFPKLVNAIEAVAAPGEIAESVPQIVDDTAHNSMEDVSAELKEEIAETNPPACQVSEPPKSQASDESDVSLKSDVPAEEIESMVVDDESCEKSIPAKGEEVNSKEEKPELKLELSGTIDSSDNSNIKSTNFSHSSRKDQEGSSSMTLSRKRAHSPVADSKELDEKLKFARTVNGFDEKPRSDDAQCVKEDVLSSKKKFEISSDRSDLSDKTASKITTEKSEDFEKKKDVPEGTSEYETDIKSKSEESLLDPVDLSYLRKLHKGRVEKLSRNDLEELLVQKLCEAITERSEVGDMRLRCQALERGQEKWKEKYTQLQKQVRELNIVIKKFLSEQASSTKDKGAAPTPVRITRSVGLQVALPGSSQRTLAGMRMRAQREAAAASSAVSSAAPAASAVASSGSTNTNKSANTNSPNVSTAQNSVPIRTVAVAQSPVRRLQETSNKIASPTIQQLPQRQINTSVSSNNTVPTANVTPPRVNAVPQPCLTLTRPLMSPQIQPQSQTNQMGGNIRARSNSTVAMRSQTHVVHQVQRQQPLQATQHSSVSQVVMSTSSTPQIGRLQVVLAPQQQQQLLQQQQQLVLRQSQPASKDVEIIDLDKDDRSRQPTRNIQQVTTTPSFAPNGNMTVRLVSNQQSGGSLTSQSHMTLLVPATAQQQKMIITSAPSTVQINSNQGKSRQNSGVVLKGVVQAMQAQGNTVRQQGVVQQGTIIPSRGLTIVQQTQQGQQQMPQLQQLRPIRQMGHPAPLPAAPTVQPDNPAWKMPPPKPSLKIQHTDNGIVLSWNMNLYSSHEDIDTYQLYAYQEGNSPPNSSLWKKVGDVKALPLPMACTLTQFAEGHRYHFAVRAVDIRARIGPFSAPGNIRLEQKAQ